MSGLCKNRMAKRKLILSVLAVVVITGLFLQSLNMPVMTGAGSSEYSAYIYTESLDSLQEYLIHKSRLKFYLEELDYNPVILNGSRDQIEEIVVLEFSFQENADKFRHRSFLTHLYTSQA